MAGISPTARSLKVLRSEGYTADKVEYTVAYSYIKKDLFGCIDIVAVKEGTILGVQATSSSNASARVKKSAALPALRQWLLGGGLFEVWGWLKSKKSRRWELRRIPVTVEDLT